MRLSVKHILLAAALGQVGSVVGGLCGVVVLSLLCSRNFFDSPIRVVVFSTSCGIIGAVSALSAALAGAMVVRTAPSVAVAVLLNLGSCSLLKLFLPTVGKLFALVSSINASCLVATRGLASAKESFPPSGVGSEAPASNAPRRGAVSRQAVIRATAASLATGLVLLAVRSPVFKAPRHLAVDNWGLLLWSVVAFPTVLSASLTGWLLRAR